MHGARCHSIQMCREANQNNCIMRSGVTWPTQLPYMVIYRNMLYLGNLPTTYYGLFNTHGTQTSVSSAQLCVYEEWPVHDGSSLFQQWTTTVLSKVSSSIFSFSILCDLHICRYKTKELGELCVCVRTFHDCFRSVNWISYCVCEWVSECVRVHSNTNFLQFFIIIYTLLSIPCCILSDKWNYTLEV